MKNTTIDVSAIIDILEYRDNYDDLREMFGFNERKDIMDKKTDKILQAIEHAGDEEGITKCEGWHAGLKKAISLAETEIELAYLMLFVIEAVTHMAVKAKMMQQNPLFGLFGLLGNE